MLPIYLKSDYAMNSSGTTLVLNVDHDDGKRHAFTRTLADRGVMVREAATGEAALHLCRAEQPAVVLLELNLPDIDAFEVCRRIKSDPGISHLQVLQISAAFTDERVVVQGYDSGADACILKPLSPGALVAVVDSFARRKDRESHLRESAQRFRRLLESETIGILVCEEERIIEANDVFLRTVGHARQQLQNGGIRWRQITAPEYAALDEAARRQLVETGECNPYEKEYIRSDGTRVPVMIGAVRLQLEPRLKCISFVVDLTERKRMEEHRLLAQKLETIGRLARGAAQRLNVATMGVLGNLHLALESSGENNEHRPFVKAAMEEANRMADLSKHLLGYGGRPRFVVEPVAISKLVNNLEGLLRASVPPRIQLTLALRDGLPLIQADGGQIQELVMNLVDNAVEAIGPERPGAIAIETRAGVLDETSIHDYVGYEAIEPGEYVFLLVRDSGLGLDESIKAKIFDPFYSTKDIGRGLGLTTVLGILRSHKGGIHVSGVPGEGTVFTVCLPIT